MSREDHNRYDAALQKLRAEMATEKEGHFNLGDSIGLVSLIVAVIFVIITPPFWVKVPLLVLSAIGLFIFFHKSHWTHSWRLSYQLAIAATVVILIALIAVPQLADQWRAEHSPKPALSASTDLAKEIAANVEEQQTVLQLDKIDRFTHFSAVRIGRIVGFRVYFANRSKGLVKNARMWGSIVVGMRATTPDEDAKAAEYLKSSREKVVDKGKSFIGPDVGSGEGVWTDVKTNPLTPEQVKALLKGDGHMYLYLWSGWGFKGAETTECLMLPKLHSNDLMKENLEWQVCPNLLQK